VSCTIPLAEGSYEFHLTTSPNGAGQTGSASFRVTVATALLQPSGGGNQTAVRVAFASAPTPATVDSMLFTDLATGQNGTLAESDDLPASNFFFGQVGNSTVEIEIASAPVLNGTVETFVANALEITGEGGLGLGNLTFTETGNTTGVFDGNLPWGAGTPTERWQQAVHQMGSGEMPGALTPIGLRMVPMGPAPDGWKVQIAGTDFALETASDNQTWVLKGGSEGFLVLVPATYSNGGFGYELLGVNASGNFVRVSLPPGANGEPPTLPLRVDSPTTASGVDLIDLGQVAVTDILVGPAGNTSLASRILPRSGNATAHNLDNIAWIEPTGGPGSGPLMPQLQARYFTSANVTGQINPANKLEVRWRLEVHYNRPFDGVSGNYGGGSPPQVNGDHLFIPGGRLAPAPGERPENGLPELAGWTPPQFLPLPGKTANPTNATETWTRWMPVSETWVISDDPIWKQELAWGLFGGEARLHCQTRQASGSSGKTETFHFRIGGKNPADSVAKAYIQANDTDPDGFEHWYAYAIAKHESKHKNVGPASRTNPGQIYGNPADPDLGLYYNQFWEGKADPPNAYMGAGFPVHNDDTLSGKRFDANGDGIPDGTGGFGLFQITRAQNEGYKYFIPRGVIWSWRENVVSGVAEKLREKRNQSLSKMPNPTGAAYVRHAVPRVRNPSVVGDPMNAAGNIATAVGYPTPIPGWIFGGDAPDASVTPNPPNAFGPFSGNSTASDYRKAAFSDRSGYHILDTIRRINGGRYVYYEGVQWRFFRWRGDGAGTPSNQQYESQSYLDLIFHELDSADVPTAYLP